MRWNCRSKALRFLQITAKNQDFPFLTVFLIIKTSFQNISITLLRFCLNFTNAWRPYWRKNLLWTILQGCRAGNHCWSKIGNGGGESFRCYDDSNVIATLMMTNFHLNTTVVAIFPNVCLWRRSLCSDLVLTLKNCVEPPSYARTAYVVAIWPSFLFDSFVKIWAT